MTLPAGTVPCRGVRPAALRRQLPTILPAAALLLGITACSQAAPQPSASSPAPPDSLAASTSNARVYPWHTGVTATTFWVGEPAYPQARDGSQSTYDSKWIQSYGGCDGLIVKGCQTQPRAASRGYAPTSVTARENPFYVGVPYDDINDAAAFKERAAVIPWANDPGYAGKSTDRSFSYMKNRWVRLRKDGRECYGQVEDAGPGKYSDRAYVFGSAEHVGPVSPAAGAGMNVSPALNACLNFRELDGVGDKLDWQFVDDRAVPDGPWKSLITTSQVQ